MIAIRKVLWGLVLFLWLAPPVLGAVYLFFPTIPGCPGITWSTRDAIMVLLLIGCFWMLGSFWTIWLRKNKAITAPNQLARRAVLGFAVCLLVGIAGIVYGGSEVYNKLAPVLERQDYIAQDHAQTIYESQNYNAFPKVLRLLNGSLWCVWYQGNWHVDTNNDGELVQSCSPDNGTTWTAPRVIADDPSYDTRNPAVGQLANGTLLLAYLLYDAISTRAIEAASIQSDDGGISWSQARPITASQFNPANETKYQWLSPFGNMFSMNGHYVAAFYGGLNSSTGEAGNAVILLQYHPANHTWQYYATPMADGYRGYNEASIQWTGDRWLCIARTSENRLYHAFSLDGIAWSPASGTTYTLGHAPDMVVLNTSSSITSMFCVYRGDNGFLRGGLARYNATANTFWCEHAILYAAKGRGGGDFGYASAVRFSSASVGFVNYDVIVCGDRGGPETRGRILWQIWKPS